MKKDIKFLNENGLSKRQIKKLQKDKILIFTGDVPFTKQQLENFQTLGIKIGSYSYHEGFDTYLQLP